MIGNRLAVVFILGHVLFIDLPDKLTYILQKAVLLEQPNAVCFDDNEDKREIFTVNDDVKIRSYYLGIFLDYSPNNFGTTQPFVFIAKLVITIFRL